MAISMIQETPDATVEFYDEVAARLRLDDDLPQGLILHSATPADDGLRMIDIWESQEDLDRFREQRLLPAIAAVMEEHGREMPPDPPDVTIGEVHHLVLAKTAV